MAGWGTRKGTGSLRSLHPASSQHTDALVETCRKAATGIDPTRHAYQIFSHAARTACFVLGTRTSGPCRSFAFTRGRNLPVRA